MLRLLRGVGVPRGWRESIFDVVACSTDLLPVFPVRTLAECSLTTSEPGRASLSLGLDEDPALVAGAGQAEAAVELVAAQAE
jgi:hypothetical protein